MFPTEIPSGMPFLDVTLCLLDAFADITHKTEAMNLRFTPVVTRDYQLVSNGRGSIDIRVVSLRLKNVRRAFSGIIAKREAASRALVKRNLEKLQQDSKTDWAGYDPLFL